MFGFFFKLSGIESLEYKNFVIQSTTGLKNITYSILVLLYGVHKNTNILQKIKTIWSIKVFRLYIHPLLSAQNAYMKK